MLSNEEDTFIQYWQANREKEKQWHRHFYKGLSFGLLLGVAIVLSLISGWYERANMVANAQVNPWVLIIAIIIISVVTSIFYKRYKWDMNEQYYRELLVKKKKSANDIATNNEQNESKS